MDPLAIAKALSDLGGWTAFLALVVAIAVGLWRRWWVPGFLYVELEAEVKALRKTVARLTLRLARDRRQRRTDG